MAKEAHLDRNQMDVWSESAGELRPPMNAAGIAGTLAAIVYVVAIIVGGLLDPSYSHAEAPISELTTVGAPNRWLIAAAFLLYNGLILVCGVTLVMRRHFANRLALAGWCLVILAVAGAAMSTLFPSDRLNQPLTMVGGVHIVLALVASLSSMTAMLAVAIATPTASAIQRISFTALVIMLLSGLIAGLAAARGWPYVGVAERLTIGVFLIWLLALSISLRSQQWEDKGIARRR